MKRRYMAFLLILMVSADWLTGCGQNAVKQQQSPPSQEKKVINIAYQNSSKTVLLAKAKGWFEEEFGKDGIEVKYGLFLSGPPMMEAFSAGRMDFATTGDMPPVSSRAAGVDVKIIGNAGREVGGSKLLVPVNSAVKSVQELKGKKVATQVGSGSHHFLVLLLQKNGLTANNINLVNLPASDWQNALVSGNVDAVSTWEPWSTSLQKANAGKAIINSKGIKDSPSVYLVRNAFAVKNPDLVKRFLKVNRRAMDYIKQNPDEAVEIVSKETKLPAASLIDSYKATEWTVRISNEDKNSFRQVKDFLRERSVIKKDFDIETLFDLSYVESLGLE